MKIWTITTVTDMGTDTSVWFTEAEANANAVRLVTKWFDEWLRADEEPRDHTDWMETYDLLQDVGGFIDTLALLEHDISAHPDLAKDRFTVWVSDKHGHGTHFVQAFIAATADEAKAAAIRECCACWDREPDEVEILGVAEGDVNVIEWNEGAA
jgi:hypothetical protein